jgi:protein-disulfide isomerase
MASIVDRLQSGVLIVVAVAIGISAVHREFLAPVPAARTPESIDYVKGWRDVLSAGIDMGNPKAPIKIVEFSDLECPFCRAFDKTLQDVTADHKTDVDVVFVHYPLPIHRFANAAARVAECANNMGRFSEMVEALFRRQDSLGVLPWSAYARDAGISDTAKITACASDTSAVKRIQSGLAAGGRLQVAGTPTVLVNGWRFGGTPSKERLLSVIDSLQHGRTPNGKKLKQSS